MTSALGDYSWSRAWPDWMYGTFNIQTAVFRFGASGNLLDFQLSNALRLEHR